MPPLSTVTWMRGVQAVSRHVWQSASTGLSAVQVFLLSMHSIILTNVLVETGDGLLFALWYTLLYWASSSSSVSRGDRPKTVVFDSAIQQLTQQSWSMQAVRCGWNCRKHWRVADPCWGLCLVTEPRNAQSLLISMHWKQDAYKVKTGHMRSSPGFSDLEPSAHST